MAQRGEEGTQRAFSWRAISLRNANDRSDSVVFSVDTHRRKYVMGVYFRGCVFFVKLLGARWGTAHLYACPYAVFVASFSSRGASSRRVVAFLPSLKLPEGQARSVNRGRVLFEYSTEPT